MSLKILSLLFCLALALNVSSQSILDSYLKIGLESNLALKQKSFDVDRARLDLRRAQSLFLPQASLNSQYTLATGGRTQDLPIGDLLNGVYSTLNQLTASNKFPQVANQTIKFLPNDYQDTRIEISMPVINSDLRYNRDIKKEMINVQQADIDIYKRELVKNIRQAYYQYLQSAKAVSIFTNALALVNENLRVSEKMVQNNIATREIILRAQAQVSQVETSLIAAQNNQSNAAAYFNFLINQPVGTDVIVDSSISRQMDTALAVSIELPNKREELTKLKSASRVLESDLKMNQSFYIPTLNAFYNVGYQGFGFKFNSDQFYQLGGIQLRWNIFKGWDNKYKIQQSQIDIEAIKNQYDDVSHQLTLQVSIANNNYRSAVEALRSSYAETQSTAETYRLAEKRFKVGQALQIELIDARTQLTAAELKFSLAQLAVLSSAAELERATASYKF